MNNLTFVYWLIHRDNEPFALLKWDFMNESCPPPAPKNEHLTKLDYWEFDMLSAFETFPVMSMDEYSETMSDRIRESDRILEEAGRARTRT